MSIFEAATDNTSLAGNPGGQEFGPGYPLRLKGRYMLPDRSEFTCVSSAVSPLEIVLEGERAGQVGERVVAYLEKLGRVEGTVSRGAQIGFAIAIQASVGKMERLANKIDWLILSAKEGLPDRRREERIEPEHEEFVKLSTAYGEFEVEVIDRSVSGIALRTGLIPPTGAAVAINGRTAIVVRQFVGGFAVRYAAPAAASSEA